jgi:Lamin Tail Domain
MAPIALVILALAQTPTLDRAHPIITEVLYAVPPREQGDADQNGTRNATGDEFIELYNAGDAPIALAGYQLVDGLPTQGKAAGDEKSHIRFTFPAATLAPKQTVVVFNGFDAAPKGEVGDSTAAKGANEHFHGALVFTMRCENQYQALSNANDMVVLLAPDGSALQCVRWDNRDEKKPRASESNAGSNEGGTSKGKQPRGKSRNTQPADKAAPEVARVRQEAPNATGSVTLQSLDGEFVTHLEATGTLFSPGEFAAGSSPAGTTAKDAKKPGTAKPEVAKPDEREPAKSPKSPR